MTTKHAPIGSVSHGTLRPEDLVPEFLYLLRQLDRQRHDELLRLYADPDGEIDYDSEAAHELMHTLHDALNEHAPPYCYFGAHEGDGADFGFWISREALDDAVHSGEVLMIDASDEWPELPQGCECVAEVTDHGNLTLYNRRGKELWAVV
jgi:hypothetical protein